MVVMEQSDTPDTGYVLLIFGISSLGGVWTLLSAILVHHHHHHSISIAPITVRPWVHYTVHW